MNQGYVQNISEILINISKDDSNSLCTVMETWLLLLPK